MHQTHAKKATNVIKVTVNPAKAAKGHQTHQSGSGKHADRRTARNRTRSQQKHNALQDCW